MALLLKGGRVVDAAAGIDAVLDVVVRDGVIVGVGEDLTIEKGQTIECAEKVLLPGLADIHVHLREPGQEYKETIATGTRAAASEYDGDLSGYRYLQLDIEVVTANEKLAMLRISNFGQTGPYRDFKLSELVLSAMGTSMKSGICPRNPAAGIAPLRTFVRIE